MEYTTICECVLDFITYVCKLDSKLFGNPEDYNLCDRNFNYIKWTIDGIYNKYLLSNSFSVNKCSPIVQSYKHISKMIKKIIKNQLETDNEQLNQQVYKLQQDLKKMNSNNI